MLISSHFPLNYLSTGLSHVDFPFILAHLWKKKHYQTELLNFRNTFAIVDNGTHERGEPLSVETIAEVLEQAPAWTGILPDYLHQPVKTWTAISKILQSRGIDLRHWGVVLHGHSLLQLQFQHDLAYSLGAGIICFPYKAPRWDYLSTHCFNFQYEQRYHLMGLAESDRLEHYATLPGKWSIDSMKIWKVDLTRPGWHGCEVNHEYHSIDNALLKRNINYLRERFHAGTSGCISSGT